MTNVTVPDFVEIEIRTEPSGASVYWGPSNPGQAKSEQFRTGGVAVLKKDIRGPLRPDATSYPIRISKGGFEDLQASITVAQLSEYRAGRPVVVDLGAMKALTWPAWFELHSVGVWRTGAILAVSVGLSLIGLYRKRVALSKQRKEDYFNSLKMPVAGDRFIGHNFGQYRVLARLGRGGMATVYRAVTLAEPHQQVALKILTQAELDPSARRRYYSEVRLAAKLRHPNIVLLHEPIEGDRFVGVAMELIEGQSLREYLRSAPLTVERFVQLVQQIAAALEHLHGQGIVHRDLKPENLMIGPDFRLKLMDFGIALDTKVERQTLAGEIIGTLTYMAPEQIRGDVLSHRTDQYALGVLFYELVATRPPFVEESAQRLLHQHLSVEPIPPTFLNDKWPEAVDAPILRMLAKSPSARYDSVSDACLALIQALA